jgi:6-phosphogluconate dehydrogenase
MTDRECDTAISGAGTMGGNFALNLADHGYPVAVYDPNTAKAREIVRREEAKGMVHTEAHGFR